MEGFLVYFHEITSQYPLVDSLLKKVEQVVLQIASHTSCLDFRLDEVEGNVRTHESQLEAIDVTLERHDSFLVAK